MEQIQLPELYPGWRSVRKIGSGSFGTVYEIERDLFGEKERSALKHIRLPQNDSEVDELYSSGYDEAGVTAHYETCLAGIVREYSLMAQMKGHGNVVYCDDVRYTARTDGVGWDITIRMELLTPLLKTLSAAYDESVVVRIGRDISRALVRCQEMNIVHRDVKPQNIFVSGSGSYKLGDFGIARTMEKTSGGTRIGTYSYMAPEVYRNQPYGSSADIYSLGLVLYWLMNERRLPFLPLPPRTPTYGQNEQARARRLNGEPLPLPKNGSAALQAIVRKACAYDPAERFASARELLDALEQIPVTEDRPEIPAEPVPVPREPEEDMTWRMVPAVPQQEEPAERILWDEPLQRTAAPKQLPRVPAVPTDAELVRPKPRVPAASPNAGTVRPAPKAAVVPERKPEPMKKKKPVKKKKHRVIRTILTIFAVVIVTLFLLLLPNF